MSRKLPIGLVMAMSLLIGAWAIAQQLELPRKDAGNKVNSSAERWPFVIIAPTGQTTFLLDSKSGDTWILGKSRDDEQAWIPVRRLDSDGK